ncbi:hypothetical protein J4425_01945 [Candidatus Woesearchaeota archaeon]|nr:hypothetical protein [Candidatus Woesearchaeota archaeon]
MNKGEALYSFVNNPSSKRRDLLNVAIENIELVKRVDSIKELRERKMITIDALKKEIEVTKKAIRYFEGLMPFVVKDREEKIHEMVEKKKVVHEQHAKVEKLSEIDLELEDIKDKLNSLSF